MGVGEQNGGIPTVFCVYAYCILWLLAPSALTLQRGGKKKIQGTQCGLVLCVSKSLLGAFFLSPLRINPLTLVL